MISDCGRYRYALWRVWEPGKAGVLFIGLNPSTADATRDDPTLRRCMGFARRWGFGGVLVANLFAYRATAPRTLGAVADPVGPENDWWLDHLRRGTDLALAAWGNYGRLGGRAAAVGRRLGRLHCLGCTKWGAPRHPLYLPDRTAPRIWIPSPASADRHLELAVEARASRH